MRKLFGTKGKLKPLRLVRSVEHVSFVLGISLCVIGIFLMVEGSILGERTTGIATVLSLVGIGLIGTSGARLLKPKEYSKET